MDKGAWKTMIHGVKKESDTTWQLNSNNNNTYIHSYTHP